MRPRDAATLIIIRDKCEVLLGKRSKGHIFMPERYVFPGGRVDAGDARVSCPANLDAETQRLLSSDTPLARARALAMAAVRETYEEAGLILGHPQAPPISSRSPHWREFFARGYVPAIDKLELVARAVTPPGRVRRFDTRFFLVDAKYMHGDLRGNGELEDLQWAPIAKASDLPLAIITNFIVELLQRRYPGSGKAEVPQPKPYYRTVNGKGNYGFLESSDTQ